MDMISSSGTTKRVQTLHDAFEIQRKTITALETINEELCDAQEGGLLTLQDLKRQNYKLHRIVDETDRLDQVQRQSRRLQNSHARWALNFGARCRNGPEVVPKKPTQSNVASTKKKRNPQCGQSSVQQTAYSGLRGITQQQSDHSCQSDLMYGVSMLRETHATELNELDSNDREIESMLDKASVTLSRLENVQTMISSEVQSSTDELNVLERKLEIAEYKQRRLNARGVRFLEGSYLRRGLNPTTDSKK